MELSLPNKGRGEILDPHVTSPSPSPTPSTPNLPPPPLASSATWIMDHYSCPPGFVNHACIMSACGHQFVQSGFHQWIILSPEWKIWHSCSFFFFPQCYVLKRKSYGTCLIQRYPFISVFVGAGTGMSDYLLKVWLGWSVFLRLVVALSWTWLCFNSALSETARLRQLTVQNPIFKSNINQVMNLAEGSWGEKKHEIIHHYARTAQYSRLSGCKCVWLLVSEGIFASAVFLDYICVGGGGGGGGVVLSEVKGDCMCIYYFQFDNQMTSPFPGPLRRWMGRSVWDKATDAS